MRRPCRSAHCGCPPASWSVSYEDGLTIVHARAEWAPEFALHALDSPEAVMEADAAEFSDDFGHYLGVAAAGHARRPWRLSGCASAPTAVTVSPETAETSARS